MQIKYLVGLDLGHGETTASCFDLTVETPVVKILQLLDGTQKTVYSAFYKDKDKFKIVKSKEDFSKKGISAYFKGRIDKLTANKQNELKTFFNLVIESLLYNNGNLHYDPKTGKRNFLLYLACPSGWIEEEENAPKKYKMFLQTVMPIEWVIKESDAAFFSFYDKRISARKSLVIDIGSSTIDFTAYGKGKIIDSWGEPDGAYSVERAILDYCLSVDPEYVENYKAFLNHWKGDPPMNLRMGMELYCRKAKELYYMTNQEYLNFYILKKDYFEGKAKGNFIECEVNEKELDEILDSYKLQIKNDLIEAKKRLNRKGFTPEVVIISGGASRMPFVKQFVQEVFKVNEKDDTLKKDDSPEHVVSHGIAKYAYVMYMIEKDCISLQEEFSRWADNNLRYTLHNALEKAMDKAEEDVLKDELTNRFAYNTSEGAAFKHLYAIMQDTVLNLTQKHSGKINDKLNTSLREAMNNELKSKVSSIIKERYGREVYPDIWFSIDFEGFIRSIPVHLENEIAELGYAGYFYFKDRDMDRDSDVRKRGIEEILSLYRERFGTFNLTLGEESYEKYIAEIKRSVNKKIRELVFEEYGLFELTK